MFNIKYFSLLAALTVAQDMPNPAPLIPEDNIPAKRAGIDAVTLTIDFAEHTRYINSLSDEDTVWGGTTAKQFTWFDQTGMGFPFSWLIYDTNVPEDKLTDGDIQYNMSASILFPSMPAATPARFAVRRRMPYCVFRSDCKAQIPKDFKAGQEVSIKIDTKPPYVHSAESQTSWKDITDVANAICDAGECVAEDQCAGLEFPKWDQAYLDDYIKY
ncbi:uncharacterized protein I303_105887 [Kwoniella dejecticola CBS 10117]|uniref:Uncharacterized protein n=1 Tax=Kwoniella dejecticola CBS 10117 TaxID=1296121 RepID=A0A1A6A0P2_9TREE|nr:uncharacterized protein I303_05909 [Kwoniella dejecticola CBS 10117]OBR83629.1 hypothetical protein I303_05909 [Kwoniella dejecticola CBS 10117]